MFRTLSARLLIVGVAFLSAPALIGVTSINTMNDFDVQIKNEYVVVDFYMTTCGPCQSLAPILAQVETQLPSVAFFKVNVQDRGLARLSGIYNIRAVPAVIIFKNGKEVARVVGNNKSVTEWVDTIKSALNI